ncbi:MAG: hypothetical protein QM831_23995 [Kofleriaceae bacterium]
MQVVILERNKLVGRKVARVFGTVFGARISVVDDVAAITGVLDQARVLCGDVFDADVIAEHVRARPSLRGVLYTAEPLKRSLKYLAESPRIDDVLARRDFESPPAAWDLMLAAYRIANPGAVYSIEAFGGFGQAIQQFEISSTAHRDSVTAQLAKFVEPFAVPSRLVDMIGEVGHEMMMNAMYDAPVDAHGRAKYAHDRKASIELPANERPTLTVGCDGTRLALQVTDPFGRLERKHVVEGLARGLAGGEQDRAHGGAGLGMLVCHNASAALYFDVVRGRSTTATAVFELDTNLRELRTQAKSLHFWSST